MFVIQMTIAIDDAVRCTLLDDRRVGSFRLEYSGLTGDFKVSANFTAYIISVCPANMTYENKSIVLVKNPACFSTTIHPSLKIALRFRSPLQ